MNAKTKDARRLVEYSRARVRELATAMSERRRPGQTLPPSVGEQMEDEFGVGVDQRRREEAARVLTPIPIRGGGRGPGG